jgi:signal transduction histidine kinase
VKRRISLAIVGVCGAVLLVLGVPLALIFRTSIHDSELIKLESIAAKTLTEIAIPLNEAQIQRVAAEPGRELPFAVYDLAGNRLTEVGPEVSDDITLRALQGLVSASIDDKLVVATPIVRAGSEEVVGVLRVEDSQEAADRKVRLTWLALLGVGFASLSAATFVAQRLSGSLAAPTVRLAGLAKAIGEGNAIIAPPVAGIPEIDVLGSALHDSSLRLNDARRRERQFSADVSHQLRTPITALRLKLERSIELNPTNQDHRAMLVDVERLGQTLDHLLIYARDALPVSETCRLDRAAAAAVARWSAQAAVAGRVIVASCAESVLASATEASVEQILDVMIDNALKSGRGQVRVSARALVGGAAIDVVDEGALLAAEIPTLDELFDRGVTRGAERGHGIGLSLARSIAEAEGGRLMVTERSPTTFSLILLAPDEE